MVHWQSSYKYGKKGESKVYPIIQQFFNRAITANEEQYAKYDYTCPQYNYEVKSRTCRSTTYPDTMITMNKLGGDRGLMLLFNFTDALYYIEYDPETFKEFRTDMFSRAKQAWDEKEHIYIPMDKLTKIHDWVY